MRFTQLQFIGLMLSACWALGVTYYQRHAEMPKAQLYAMTAYFTCAEREAAAGKNDLAPCLANVGSDWEKWMNRKWRDIAYIALIPIGAGWLIGFVCVRVYRWQKRRTSS